MGNKICYPKGCDAILKIVIFALSEVNITQTIVLKEVCEMFKHCFLLIRIAWIESVLSFAYFFRAANTAIIANKFAF
nr:MAG TPA: hypothetical protein [Caudoviricetes sp.]